MFTNTYAPTLIERNEVQMHTFTHSLISSFSCVFSSDELYIKSEPKGLSVDTGMSVSLVCEFRAHYANQDTNRLLLDVNRVIVLNVISEC